MAFTATAARRDDVLLDEGRRHLQRRGDVVEALGHVVGRQHLGGVEVHRQQIAHGVAVFLAVQPVQHERVRSRAPGSAARSSVCSSHATSASAAGALGCRAFGGGITRPRTLRTAFSNTSACWPMLFRRQVVEADAGRLHAVVVTGGAVPASRWRAGPASLGHARAGGPEGPPRRDVGLRVHATRSTRHHRPPPRGEVSRRIASRIRRQISPEALERAADELVGIPHLRIELLRRFGRHGLARPAAAVEQRAPAARRSSRTCRPAPSGRRTTSTGPRAGTIRVCSFAIASSRCVAPTMPPIHPPVT